MHKTGPCGPVLCMLWTCAVDQWPMFPWSLGMFSTEGGQALRIGSSDMR